MTVRLTFGFVVVIALLWAYQAQAQQQRRLLLGVIEDHLGNNAGQPYFRAVRVVFEKKGN